MLRKRSAMEVLNIMRLSSRFILDNLFLLAAAFLVVASMTWSAGVAGWIAFGVSAAITVIAGTSAVLTARSGRKLGHGLVGLSPCGRSSRPWPSPARC